MEKTSLAKYIVGLALFIITGILAAATIYFDAFTPFWLQTWTSDDYAFIGVITVFFGPFLFCFWLRHFSLFGTTLVKNTAKNNIC